MHTREPDAAPTALPQPSLPHGDQRVGQRFSLLIRAAKLVADSGEEFLCVIRDISRNGVRLRLFHPLAFDRPFALELANGQRFGVERVWQRGDEGGYRFAAPVDTADLIDEPSLFARRALRLRLVFPADIGVGSETHRARLLDLSRQGARLSTEMHLAIGQSVRISAEGLPMLSASVCWRREPDYGLVFRQCFTFEQLARFAAWRQGLDVPSLADQAGRNAMALPFMQ